MKKYKWGVIATGKMADVFTHALQALKNKGELDLQAVASRSLDKAQAFAQKWGFSQYYGTYEEVFSDPDVDIVYIATPHDSHAQLSMAALRAGKHVVCEKPASVYAEELEEVLATAKATGKFFLEALWMRFNPAVKRAFDILHSGRLGSLLAITANFHIYRPIDLEHRRYKADTAGGALLDIGIYPLTFALACAAGGHNLKEPQSMQALAHFYEQEGTDRWTMINLLFTARDKSIIAAQLSCSFDVEHEHLKEAWIIGSEAKIRLPLFWQAQEIEVWDTDSVLLETQKIPFEVNGYEYEIRNTMQCISQGLRESPLHTHSDSLLIAKTLDSIRKQINLVYPADKKKTVQSNGLSKQTNNGLSVYTDGGCSKNPGPGGWAYIIVDTNTAIEQTASGGDADTTNNRMELLAVINALEAIVQRKDWEKQKMTFYIDSQYVKDGITLWITTWKKNGWKTSTKTPVKNQDLWIELDELCQKRSIDWQWIKGHSGIHFNELADTLCQTEIKKFLL